MRSGAELVAAGRALAPGRLGTTALLRAHGAASESHYKRERMARGEVMYHAHIGLSDWHATERALHHVHEALGERGYRLDRYGLALDRAMGVPAGERDTTMKETGPRLGDSDWQRLGEAVPVQPHLGDFMIGFPAGLENTLHAVRAGVSTVGNLGQYLAFDLVGGSNEGEVTETTVQALGVLAALRDHGAIAHSNLDDGPGMQTTHFGSYVGWAAVELYLVEQLIGARLTHCYGNLINSPVARAVVHFALDDIRGRRSIGSMMYGNTVGHVAHDRARNTAVLTQQVMIDIALQLRRPTGHAVNPVPLTEAERIPSAEEIVEAHLLARELEKEVRESADLYDWDRLESMGAATARYALEFRDRALALLARDGVDVADAAQLLLALRRTGAAELERLVNLAPSPDVARLEPWKSRKVREAATRVRSGMPRLDGIRVVLAVLEVHDVMRDAIASALPAVGAEVVVLPATSSIESVACAALDEDADALVVGTYNGNALDLAERLAGAAGTVGYRGRIVMGGVLNQDFGDDLPVDATDRIESLGITCLHDASSLGPFLATLRDDAREAG